MRQGSIIRKLKSLCLKIPRDNKSATCDDNFQGTELSFTPFRNRTYSVIDFPREVRTEISSSTQHY